MSSGNSSVVCSPTFGYSKTQQIIYQIALVIGFIFGALAGVLSKYQSASYGIDTINQLKDAQQGYREIKSQIQSQLQLEFHERDSAPQFYGAIIKHYNSLFDSFDDDVLIMFKKRFPSERNPDDLTPLPHYRISTLSKHNKPKEETKDNPHHHDEEKKEKNDEEEEEVRIEMIPSLPKRHNKNFKRLPNEYYLPSVFSDLRGDFEQRRLNLNTEEENQSLPREQEVGI
jgi:hypothetical protein